MAWLRPSRRSQRGVILFTALWTLSLLSLIAVSLMMVSRTDRLLARNALQQTRAELAAEAGIARAIAALVTRNPGDLWPIDGTPRTLEIDGFIVDVAIQDELGKVDINQASETMLGNLFVALGVQRQTAIRLADAIADWRDADDSKRLNGAEINEYATTGLDYGPRNAAFETVEELQLVLGMTSEIFTATQSYLTVYSQRSQVNILTAATLARASLGETIQSRQHAVTPQQINYIGGQAFNVSVTLLGNSILSNISQTTVRLMGKRQAFVVLDKTSR